LPVMVVIWVPAPRGCLVRVAVLAATRRQHSRNSEISLALGLVRVGGGEDVMVRAWW
jgi:hypothetical protein